jgi:cytochrome c biogenesis protein CcdA
MVSPTRTLKEPHLAARERSNEDGLDRLAWWLDSSIAVPGTRFRIGFDALIGLVPGIGDLIGTALSAYIVAAAARRGMPGSVLLRMAFNVGVETIVGAVPILGDLFDAAWKANQRNVDLLRQYSAAPRRAQAQSRLVVGLWLVVLLAIAAVFVLFVYAVLRWTWQQIQ